MNERDELGLALEACLVRIQEDGVDIDAAVSAYPRLASALRPLLVLADTIGATPAPDPSETFRTNLAAALAAAPGPASLRASETESLAQDAETIQGASHDHEAATVLAGAQTPEAAAALPTTELVRALDAVLDPDADPSELLERDPALAAELAPLVGLADSLRQMSPADGPRETFRAELASALADARTPRSVREAPRPTSLWAAMRRLARSTAVTAAAAATVVIFIAAGATYASADALPGQPLYSVKRAAERARALMTSGEAELRLHLELADLRLSEALAAPPYAGEALADFSREVTAALVVADGMLSEGHDRDAVTQPLLAWLLNTRGELVHGRPALPPTAWRASLALCDEAISALSSGHTLAVAPVPRLADPSDILAQRAALTSGDVRGPVSWRSQRDAFGGTRKRLRPSTGDENQAPRPTRLYVVVTSTPAAVAMSPPGAAGPEGQADPANIGGQGSSGDQDRARRDSAKPGEDSGGSVPQEPPRRAIPTQYIPPTKAPPSTLPPTAKPEPSLLPPTAPSAPTATEPPPMPTSEPPTAAPTDLPGTPTPAVPTPPPSTPTVPVIDKDPIIYDVFCDDAVIDLYKSTSCHVVAVDPEGQELQYYWVADAPEMLNERQKDSTYYAAWGVGGGTLRIRITVYVCDRGAAVPGADGVAQGETHIDVRSLDDGGG
jgi:hypothetical protein